MFLILDQLAVADDLAQLGDRRTPPRELFRRKFSCCIRLPKPLKRSFYNGFAGPVPRNFIDLLMSNFCILS